MMSTLAQISMALLVIIFIFILARGLLRRAIQASPSRLSSSSRRLGKFEEYLEIFSNERQGTTNTCYVMSLHSKEKLKQSLVFDALIRLAKRQPMLRAVIKVVSKFSWFGRNSDSYFEIIEPNKIGDMIDLTKSDLKASQWQKAWHDIVMRPIKTGLLWQAVLFAEEYDPDSENYVNTIIFRVNHCIVDGVSGMKLFKQFLRHLNSLYEDPRVGGEDVPTLELLPSFYELISNNQSRSLWKDLQESLGLNFVYKFVRRLRFRILLAHKPEKPYPFLMTQPSLEVHDLVYKVFSERQTLQICKVCRSKGVTVTAALIAAAHKALCKLFGNQGLIIAKNHQFIHFFAVNGLRVCKPKPPVDYLGNFLLTDILPMSSNIDDFWSIAQEATKEIKTKISDEKFASAQLAEFDIFTPREIAEEFHSPLDTKKKLKLFTENYLSSAGAFTFDGESVSMYKLHECLYYSVPFGYNSISCHFNMTVNDKMAWVIMCSKFVPHTIEQQFAMLCFDTLLNETQQE